MTTEAHQARGGAWRAAARAPLRAAKSEKESADAVAVSKIGRKVPIDSAWTCLELECRQLLHFLDPSIDLALERKWLHGLFMVCLLLQP